MTAVAPQAPASPQPEAAETVAWIDVNDRLPDVTGIEDGETVLIANSYASFAAEWHGTGITGFSSIHGDQFVEVTHWMPIPSKSGTKLHAAPQPTPQAAEASDAARDVLAERRRQVSVEGWTPEHDDKHNTGDLAEAAAAYAVAAAADGHFTEDLPPAGWPWDDDWWKPATPRRMLVKSGALILAEIERLDREADRKSRHAAAAPWLE